MIVNWRRYRNCISHENNREISSKFSTPFATNNSGAAVGSGLSDFAMKLFRAISEILIGGREDRSGDESERNVAKG